MKLRNLITSLYRLDRYILSNASCRSKKGTITLNHSSNAALNARSFNVHTTLVLMIATVNGVDRESEICNPHSTLSNVSL